jgi:hypothetical protein
LRRACRCSARARTAKRPVPTTSRCSKTPDASQDSTDTAARLCPLSLSGDADRLPADLGVSVYFGR